MAFSTVTVTSFTETSVFGGGPQALSGGELHTGDEMGPHHMGMSIIQKVMPYPHRYDYFPGSGQATNRLMYGKNSGTGFSFCR